MMVNLCSVGVINTRRGQKVKGIEKKMSWLDAGFWRLLSKMKPNQSGIEWGKEQENLRGKLKGFKIIRQEVLKAKAGVIKEWKWLAITLLLATKSTILNNVTLTTDIQVTGTSETWVSNRNLHEATETTQHFSFAKKTKTPLRNAYKRIAINVDYQKPPWTVSIPSHTFESFF